MGGNQEPTTDICKSALKELQKAYVIGEADKKSGVYTLQCTSYYVDKLSTNLESGVTYTFAGYGSAPARKEETYVPTVPLPPPPPQPPPPPPPSDEEGFTQPLPDSLDVDLAILSQGAWHAVPPPPQQPPPQLQPLMPPQPPLDAYATRLHADYEFSVRMGMISEAKDGEGKAFPKIMVTDPVTGEVRGETKKEHWIRNHRLASQYATVKTHNILLKLREIAGGINNSLECVNQWVSRILLLIKPELDKLMSEATSAAEAKWLKGRFFPNIRSFIVQQSKEVAQILSNSNAEKRRHRSKGAVYASQRRENTSGVPLESEQRAPQSGAGHHSVQDFTTLFPSMHHSVIKTETQTLLEEIVDRHALGPAAARKHCFLKVKKERPTGEEEAREIWVADRGNDTAVVKFFSMSQIIVLIEYILDYAYTTFGGKVYKQHAGVPIGFGASPALANFALVGRELKGVRTCASSTRNVQRLLGAVVHATSGEVLGCVAPHCMEQQGLER